MSTTYTKSAETSSTTGLVASKPTYVRSGIGGAGNFRSHKTTPSVSVTAPITIPRPSGHFYSGIGGSGNSRSFDERAKLSFEDHAATEELRKENAPSSFHLGIGGRGNRAGSFEGSRPSSLRGSISSNSSSPSEKRRLSSYFKI